LSFFSCLVISIFVKSKYGVEGDYLSAFSTLIAALVALYLYNDWRDEHRLKLLEHYHSRIKEGAYAAYLKVNYLLIDHPIFKLGENDHEEFENQKTVYIKDVDKLAESLTELCISVNEYENFLGTLECTALVEEMVVEVKQFNVDLNDSFNKCMEILDDFNTLDPKSSENKDKINFIWDILVKIKISSSFNFSNFYIEYLNKSK